MLDKSQLVLSGVNMGEFDHISQTILRGIVYHYKITFWEISHHVSRSCALKVAAAIVPAII